MTTSDNRETLKWACAFMNDPVHRNQARKWSVGESEACQAVATPSILNGLIVDECRRLGLSVHDNNKYAESIMVFWYPVNGNLVRKAFDMDKAREILQALLGLSDGDTTGALKVLS